MVSGSEREDGRIQSTMSKASKLIDPNEFLIVAVLPITLEKAVRLDRQVVRSYKHNKYKQNDEQLWIRLK